MTRTSFSTIITTKVQLDQFYSPVDCKVDFKITELLRLLHLTIATHKGRNRRTVNSFNGLVILQSTCVKLVQLCAFVVNIMAENDVQVKMFHL